MAFALVALVALGVAPALAGTTPADGDWRYDNAPTLSTACGGALFQTLVTFAPGQRNIRSVQGVVMHGTCKEKDGRTLHDALVDFSVNGYTKGIISVKSDGSFAGTLKSITDTGTHGLWWSRGLRREACERNGHRPQPAHGIR